MKTSSARFSPGHCRAREIVPGVSRWRKQLRGVGALAIGLLIGLQRQFAWAQEPPEEDEELFAGTRTLALVVLFGAVSAHFTEVLDEPLVFGAALLALELQTRSLVPSITRDDVHATLKFAVISVIILPNLPRRGVGLTGLLGGLVSSTAATGERRDTQMLPIGSSSSSAGRIRSSMALSPPANC